MNRTIVFLTRAFVVFIWVLALHLRIACPRYGLTKPKGGVTISMNPATQNHFLGVTIPMNPAEYQRRKRITEWLEGEINAGRNVRNTFDVLYRFEMYLLECESRRQSA